MKLNEFEREVKAFCDANYGRTLGERLRKIGEEFGELAQAVVDGTPAEILYEAADIAIVLTDLCQLLPGTPSLEQAMRYKFEAVKSRKPKAK